MSPTGAIRIVPTLSMTILRTLLIRASLSVILHTIYIRYPVRLSVSLCEAIGETRARTLDREPYTGRVHTNITIVSASALRHSMDRDGRVRPSLAADGGRAP